MSDIHITDHALLRYIERVKGIDLVPLRDEIRKLVRQAVQAGASEVTVGGHSYHLTPDGTVKTVVARGGSPRMKISLQPRPAFRERA